ncbi:hypothetical protein chiPu_0028116 [Chiloscyllium punctatum]|uniref:VWFD domain-containing protein n=1 Tax=Chiloscyllium punctatum TaxID=137246 RepID=A0A401TNW1_CHIPU|nr:hypothetical protein [Chiloscyllium punctatum]
MQTVCPLLLQVDGALISLPYSPPHGRFSAYRSGRLGVVSADFGLRLTFDWHLRLTLALPSTYSGSVQGLCGDFDGRTEGELLLPGGQPTSDVQEFGEAWMVEGSARCDRDCAPNCPLPPPAAEVGLSGVDRCGVLQSPTGPFRDCLGNVDPEPYHQDCALDVGLRRGHQGALCDALTVYTAACQEAGSTVHPWRNATFCREYRARLAVSGVSPTQEPGVSHSHHLQHRGVR